MTSSANSSKIEDSSTLIKIERLKSAGSGGSGIVLEWSDGTKIEFSSQRLRQNCPCAECEQKRGSNSHNKPLSGIKSSLRVISATEDEALNLKEIWPVGNYALGMKWGDGHDSGIYSFRLLKQLQDDSREDGPKNGTGEG